MIRRTFFYGKAHSAFQDEVTYCVQRLKETFDARQLVGVTFLLKAVSDGDYFDKKRQIQSSVELLFGNLPVSVISQPAGDVLAMEVWVHNAVKSLVHKKFQGIKYTLYLDEFGRSLWGLGLASDELALSMKKQTLVSFEKLQLLLSNEGFTMDDLVRQWSFIPTILKTIDEKGQTYQYYQIFNDIRQSYYTKYKQDKEYPAATGIGMHYGNMTIDFVAVQGNSGTQCVGLANPYQINAYDYNQELLIGAALEENGPKNPPLFERAKYIGNADSGLVFVSGTASIIGEETIGINDIRKQTETTLRNIKELVSGVNISRSVDVVPGSMVYDYLRAYIKNEADFGVVRQLCNDQVANVPVLYVHADVCRDDLLVEIEGEISFR